MRRFLLILSGFGFSCALFSLSMGLGGARLAWWVVALDAFGLVVNGIVFSFWITARPEGADQ